MKLNDFLKRYSGSLKDKIADAFSAVYDPEKEGSIEKEYREKLETLARKPFPKQIEATIALTKGYTSGRHGEIMVGEMGTGKTTIGVCTSYLLLKPKSRTIVICPGHLVEKWKREILTILPSALVIDLNQKGLKELIELRGNPKPKGREFYVIGKERAKNHFTRKPAVCKRLDKWACPECGNMFMEFPSVEKRKPFCDKCKSPLWQADNAGFNRYAKSEFIKRYLPKNIFDLCIGDEVHQFKSGESAQGQAFANLVNASRRTLCLSGTLMGGYSSNLFYLLYRILPSRMKDVCDYDSPMSFSSKYGIIERIEKVPIDEANTASIGGRGSQRIKERPGISPVIFTDLLLECSVFIKLNEVSENLPPFKEQVIEVDMGEIQRNAYLKFEADLKEVVRKALARGDKTLLGAMINSLLAYPDGARRGEAIVHPRDIDFKTGEKKIVCTAPEIDESILPKEEELLKIVEEQKRQNRKTMVCLEHTGTRDLIPDLKERLESRGFSVLVLRSSNPPVATRETWVKNKIKNGDYDVMITNPRLIETGLDLLEFPTIVFYQTGYSVFTLRQASRRSWRIGQERPVEVYYMVYGSTMQQVALSLMADKMQVALAVEGDLSDKGLTEIAQGDTSMLIKMAKSLLGEEQPESTITRWAGFAESAVTSDERLDKVSKPTVIATETETIETKIAVEGTRETLEISIKRVVRGKIHQMKDYAIGIVDEKLEFRFQNGNVFFKDRLVGEYDKKGNGNINGKLIQIVSLPESNVYQLVELQKVA